MCLCVNLGAVLCVHKCTRARNYGPVLHFLCLFLFPYILYSVYIICVFPWLHMVAPPLRRDTRTPVV